MSTVYDFVTVALFASLVAVFLFLTDRRSETVSCLLISGVSVAVANQLGNAGQGTLAVALLAAAMVYAALIVRAHPAND